MNNIRVINIKQEQEKRLLQFIDLAGFKVVYNSRNFSLLDKNSDDGDNYSDLTFKSLAEAIKAVAPYLKNQYKFVA